MFYIIRSFTIFHFKSQKHLTQTSCNSNFFQFPLAVRVKWRQLYPERPLKASCSWYTFCDGKSPDFMMETVDKHHSFTLQT